MCEPLLECLPPPEWRGAEKWEDPFGAETCGEEKCEDEPCGAEKCCAEKAWDEKCCDDCLGSVLRAYGAALWKFEAICWGILLA